MKTILIILYIILCTKLMCPVAIWNNNTREIREFKITQNLIHLVSTNCFPFYFLFFPISRQFDSKLKKMRM